MIVSSFLEPMWTKQVKCEPFYLPMRELLVRHLQKSEIFCSRNVLTTYHNNIARILGVQTVLGTGKYLGLPSMIGRSKKFTFSFIKDIIWKKINSWSSKNLSKASREVLIKFVLQSIPTYFMSLFTLPISLCDEIERMMNSFWWGHLGGQSRGINWLSWDKLSMHKNVGGMSFKNLPTFNLAMLRKQGWRLITNPDSLVARLYKAKYYHRCNFFESTLGHKPSFVWRSICNSKFILKAGSRWRIGDGDDISVWYNKWIANDITLVDLRVPDCMLHDCKEWNLPFLQSIFGHHVVVHIVKTPLYPSVTEDRLI